MQRYILASVMILGLIGTPAWADDQHHPAGVQSSGAAQTQTQAALGEPTIKALQEALSKQGIAVKVDGALSDETRAAIRTYQTQHHLPVTGEPDKATLDKLGVRQETASAQSPTTGQGPQAAGTDCPMMPAQQTQAMMQMMQGMMQMMQSMHGQMQPGQMGPGRMQPGQMQPK
jgi:hypothetical protein